MHRMALMTELTWDMGDETDRELPTFKVFHLDGEDAHRDEDDLASDLFRLTGEQESASLMAGGIYLGLPGLRFDVTDVAGVSEFDVNHPSDEMEHITVRRSAYASEYDLDPDTRATDGDRWDLLIDGSRPGMITARGKAQALRTAFQLMDMIEGEYRMQRHGSPD